MRFLITLCLVSSFAAPCFARGFSSENPVQTESSLPSITLSYAGETAGNYNIRVSSKANRTVLAFSLRLVPSGTAQMDGHFACDGQCGRSIVMGTSAKPAIKSGARQLSFPIGKINGGAVEAEAAIFADGSYEGDPHAAAFLVAKLLGSQTEFDRLEGIAKSLAGSAGETQDAARLRITLDELPASVTSGMLRSFRQWFPDLAECRQYTRAMKGAMLHEKALAIQDLEVFTRQASSAKVSVRVWWVSTQAQLVSLGCSGCALPDPKTHIQLAASGCSENAPGAIYVAAEADPGTDDLIGLGEDAEPDSDIDSEDWEAIDAESASAPAALRPDNPHAPAKPTPSELGPVAAKDVPPQVPPMPPKTDVRPSGIPFMRSRDGKTMLWRGDYQGRPMPASAMYEIWFRDIGQFGDLALHRNVIWEDGAWKKFEKDDPPAGGLKNAEITALKQVVTSCNAKSAVAFQKREVLIRAQTKGLPGGWALYAPGMSMLRHPQSYNRTLFTGCVQQLRTKVNASSFRTAENFVYDVYHAVPGKVVTEAVPDNLTYARFFFYMAWVNDLVSKNDAEGVKEANRRKQELRNLGLGKDAWVLLAKVADDFRPPHLDMVPGAASSISGGLRAEQLPGAETPGIHPYRVGTPVRPGLQVTSGGYALQTITSVPLARTQDAADSKKHDINAHLAMLETGLGKLAFKKFDRYVHKLYASDIQERIVPITEARAKK